ncbi:MAG: MATE family efflux transporter, partial [Dorea sp.]
MNQQNPLATEKISKLIAKFAIPAIISMLVSSLYNIVDQIFIGQGVGMLGNAATNIAFPISTICTATALFLGVGSASNYNLETGAGNNKKAVEIARCGLAMLGISGVIIAVIVLAFLDPLLSLFGVTKDVLPYAQEYAGITAFGIPFLILTTGGNHLIRADRSPTYSMTCMLTGAIINTILDPLFIFVFHWGIQGAAWATVIGQVASGIMVIVYFAKFRHMELGRKIIRPKGKYLKMIASLGVASCINQIAIALVQIVMNNTLRYYGEQSIYGTDIPIACVGVISKVNMVFMAICIGISQGCQPIWGFNYGAAKYERVRKTYQTAFGLCMALGIICFLCFQLFPCQIVAIFGSGSEEYFQFAEQYLRIFMLFT